MSAFPCPYLYGKTDFKITYNNTILTRHICGAKNKTNTDFLTGYSGFLPIMCVLGIVTVVFLYVVIWKKVSKQDDFRNKYKPPLRRMNLISKEDNSENTPIERKYSNKINSTENQTGWKNFLLYNLKSIVNPPLK